VPAPRWLVRSRIRLLALAGFLLTVALVLSVAEVPWRIVGIVMAAALAIAWAVEWSSSRRARLRSRVAEPNVPPPGREQAPEPGPAGETREAPPEAKPPGEPGPSRPPLRPVPSPPPPAPPPAARPPAAAGVVELRRRGIAQPRRWNLWDLERIAREESQHDPSRSEEWSYLFIHLRRFAAPDGSLPTEFDALVRESFGELLEQRGA
jgi:hypothetical protein